MPVKKDTRAIRGVRLLMNIGGCTCFGYAFGWPVGLGLFLCLPSLFAAIRRK